MYSTLTPKDSYPINESLLTSQWFDYTPQMNAIINAFHKRIFKLEVSLQTSNQILDRSQTIKDHDSLSRKTNMMGTQQILSHESVRNSIDTLSSRSARHSLIPDQERLNLTLDKHFHQLNLSPHVLFDQTTSDNNDSSNLTQYAGKLEPIPSLSSASLPPNQMKRRAYELATIFVDAFDQLNIIYNTSSIDPFNRNNNQVQLDHVDSNNISSLTDCSPFALNLAGIITLTEQDKFRYENKYFFHVLLLLFRVLLLESQTDFLTSINNIHNQLPSIQLNELNNRLTTSQDNIKKLSFIKKHFHTDKSQQLNVLNSTKAQLKDRLMEEKYRSKIALRYCNDWKNNHVLQWIEMLSQTEEKYTKTIHQYETILKQTEITHQETIQILTKQNNEIKINVKKWYEYYQNETYRFERELISFRYEFNQIKKQRQDMYEEYQRMKIIVDEYHQMKMNEKLILEKQKQEEDAMKRIQAWWRGTMVRHGKQKRRKKKKKK